MLICSCREAAKSSVSLLPSQPFLKTEEFLRYPEEESLPEHNRSGRLTELESTHTVHDAFAQLFFRFLEEQRIRYCLLHPCEATLEDLSSDLRLAIHPDDEGKWPRVVEGLSASRFLPLRSVRCANRTWRYDFAWFASTRMNSMAVYVILKDEEGDLTSVSGFCETLANSRKKQYAE